MKADEKAMEPRESENGDANKRVDTDSAVGESLKKPMGAVRCAGHPEDVELRIKYKRED